MGILSCGRHQDSHIQYDAHILGRGAHRQLYIFDCDAGTCMLIKGLFKLWYSHIFGLLWSSMGVATGPTQVLAVCHTRYQGAPASRCSPRRIHFNCGAYTYRVSASVCTLCCSTWSPKQQGLSSVHVGACTWIPAASFQHAKWTLSPSVSSVQFLSRIQMKHLFTSTVDSEGSSSCCNISFHNE